MTASDLPTHTTDPASNERPAASVVVVTTENAAAIRRTLRCLRQQTVADRLELLIVHPAPDSLADAEPGELDGFHRVETICFGRPIDCIEEAVEVALNHATAEVFALIEDHAFPIPSWAERLVAAHAMGHAAVGSAMHNANPDGVLSWANLLVAYGPWTMPSTGRTVAALPGHNASYRTDALKQVRHDGEPTFGRETGLHDKLKARGGTLYIDPEASVEHLNPSRWSSTIALRVDVGRLYAATRAQGGRWGLGKRLIYIAGGPAIPLVRLPRVHASLSPAVKQFVSKPKLFAALTVGLALDAVGQMIGYALGGGGARDRLATFEIDRMRHLTAREQDLNA